MSLTLCAILLYWANQSRWNQGIPKEEALRPKKTAAVVSACSENCSLSTLEMKLGSKLGFHEWNLGSVSSNFCWGHVRLAPLQVPRGTEVPTFFQLLDVPWGQESPDRLHRERFGQLKTWHPHSRIVSMDEHWFGAVTQTRKKKKQRRTTPTWWYCNHTKLVIKGFLEDWWAKLWIL